MIKLTSRSRSNSGLERVRNVDEAARRLLDDGEGHVDRRRRDGIEKGVLEARGVHSSQNRTAPLPLPYFARAVVDLIIRRRQRASIEETVAVRLQEVSTSASERFQRRGKKTSSFTFALQW